MKFDVRILSLAGLRAAALALSLAGQTRTADALYTLADGAEAGVNVDEHMRRVSEKLKMRASNDADWVDVVARIEADSDLLQAVRR